MFCAIVVNMIQPGEKFTVHDLKRSVREVCSTDILQHVNRQYPANGVIMGNNIFIPAEQTPSQYAIESLGAWGDTPSSAMALDTQLKKHGFKTTYKFAHKYNTPGLSNEQIINDAYQLEWFKQIYETTQPAPGHEKPFLDTITNAFRISYYYAQYLWACNSRECRDIAQQLNTPAPEQWDQITSTILGTGFQFHPTDVYEYAINHINPAMTREQRSTSRATQQDFKDNMMKNHGIDTGCLVLSKQNRDKLNKIVTKTDTSYWIQLIEKVLAPHHR